MEPSIIVAELLGKRGEHFSELRKHTHVRQAAIDPADILAWVELERLINETGVKRTLYRDGKRTDSPTILDVMRQVREGATLQLQHVEEYCPRIASIVGELSAALAGETTNSNIYLAPSKDYRAFPVHHDTVDTIVLQISGHKRWKVWRPIIPDPIWIMRNHNYHVDDDIPNLDVILEPGDVLYLKRGDPHQVQCAGDQASLHVNLRVEPTTGSDIFEWIVHEALEDPKNRSSMPVGPNVTVQDQLMWFSSLLNSINEFSGRVVNQSMMDKYLSDRTAAAHAPAVFIGALLPDLIEITPTTAFSLVNPMLRTAITERGIVVHGQLLEMPKHLLCAVSQVLAQPSAHWTARQFSEEFSISVDEVCDLLHALVMHNVLRLLNDSD